MVGLTEKDYAKFKALCDKHGIKYDTEMEYRESANSLVSFVKLLYEMSEEHRMWDERLKDEPKGFAIASEGRSCCLCRETVYGQVWYDKWGMKCMSCQDALNKKIVPGYVFKDKDNNRHVTASQLHWKYGVHPQTIKKLIRLGELKPRQVPHGPTVFLRKENPDLPKVIKNAINK